MLPSLTSNEIEAQKNINILFIELIKRNLGRKLQLSLRIYCSHARSYTGSYYFKQSLLWPNEWQNCLPLSSLRPQWLQRLWMAPLETTMKCSRGGAVWWFTKNLRRDLAVSRYPSSNHKSLDFISVLMMDVGIQSHGSWLLAIRCHLTGLLRQL